MNSLNPYQEQLRKQQEILAVGITFNLNVMLDDILEAGWRAYDDYVEQENKRLDELLARRRESN